MRVWIGLIAGLAVVTASCTSMTTSGPSIEAAPVTPVMPVPPPYGGAPPAASRSGPPAGSVYRSGAHGYDASFPQCRARTRPPAARLSVIGVNKGKVFTTNPCLASLWRAAPRPRALYLNTGYLAANRGLITPGCATLGRRLRTGPAQREAYALGCAAAVYSRRALQAEAIGAPAMWWLDVELANSWSDTNVDLNRYELQGQIDQLDATRARVGVYSTVRAWRAITGGWAPGGIDADWTAGVPVQSACAGTSFGGHTVWLAQEAAPWPESGFDSDFAC